jgi:hypothetical protein
VGFDRGGRGGGGGGEASHGDPAAPGRRTLAQGPPGASSLGGALADPGRRSLVGPSVQTRATGGAPQGDPHEAAQRGVSGADAPLPYLEQIRRLFGRHDVSDVRVAIGEAAKEAGNDLGASAYAYGNRIAFGSAPDLHTAAHEAAHVVQQRAGVSPKGAGKPGDRFEQHADAVADAVVAGRSAEALLDTMTGNAPAAVPVAPAEAAVQRKDTKDSVSAKDYVQNRYISFHEDVKHAFDTIHLVKNGPYGKELDNGAFQDALHKYIKEHCTAHLVIDGYQRFVAPEPIEPMIERARAHDTDWSDEDNPKPNPHSGPDSDTFASPIAVEVTNALARRYVASIQRVLPLYLDKMVGWMSTYAMATGEDPRTMKRPPAKELRYTLVAGHPMEAAVLAALDGAQDQIPFEKLAANTALWDKYAAQNNRTIADPNAVDPPRIKPCVLEFQAERGLFHWVRASTLDGSEVTAIDVAAQLFGTTWMHTEEATEEAYRLIAVPPLWGFRGEDIAVFAKQSKEALSAQWYADLKKMPTFGPPQMPDWPGDIVNALGVALTIGNGGMLSTPTDPIVELSAKDPDHALARARSAEHADPAHPKDAASVVSRMQECQLLLQTIGRALNVMEADVTGASMADVKLSDRITNARAGVDQDPQSSFSLADQQGVVLADIASGLNELSIKYSQYKPPDDPMDPGIRQIVDDCIDPFQKGLDALEFPEVATERIALGTQRTLCFDISVQELSLHTGMNVVDEQLDHDKPTDGVDAEAQKKQTNEFTADLAQIRMQIAGSPAQASQDLAAKAPGIGDLEFDIALGEKLMRLDDFWRAIENEEGFWEDIFDYMEGENIQAQCIALRQKFVDNVKTPYLKAKDENDDAGKVAAREAFRTLILDEFIPMATKIRGFLKQVANHKKWTKIIAGIMIAIAAFALGQYAMAAMIAAEVGTIGAAVVAGVVTTTSSMVMEKVILGHDPTLGSLITGFVGNIAIFGIMAKAAMAAKAAGMAMEVGEATAGAAQAVDKAGKVAAATGEGITAAKAAKWLGSFTYELVLGEAIILVQSEASNLIDNGRMLTGDEMAETLAMGVVNIIGMKIGQFAFDRSIENFKAEKAARGVDVQGLIDARLQLEQAGRELHLEAGGDNHLAKGKAPREKAQAVVDQWQRYWEKKAEVSEKLLELAERHPERFKSKLKELEKLKVDGAAEADLVTQFREARALLGIEEIGPNVFRGDPAAMDAILHQHAAAGSEVIGVKTDPVTGQRTISIKAEDGMPFDIIEKLPDPGKRAEPKVPVGVARHFEEWLENRDRSTPQAVKERQRLLDYYARDPDGAIKLASEHYNYAPAEVPTPELMVQPDVPATPVVETPAVTDPHPAPARTKPAAPEVPPGEPATPSEARRAFEQYEADQAGAKFEREQGKESVPTNDTLTMSRSDFERMYRGGFEYDPVIRGWRPRRGATPAADTGMIAKTDVGTHVLGEVHSEAVGHEVLRKLVSGETEALRLVGIEPPPEFDSRGNEWAIGRDQNGKIVLIRGGKGAVDWSLIPGVEDVAHSHPYLDPVTGKPRTLKGEGGTGVLDIEALKTQSPSNQTLMDLLYVMPSTGDLRFVALENRPGHRLHTPYISLGEGKIGNPVDGGLQPTVEIEITHAEALGLLAEGSEIVVYRGELTLWAGDAKLGTLEIYQRYHSSGSFGMDWITTERPSSVVPLPADHPIARYQATPASEVTGVGHVTGETMAKLLARGFPKPGENRAIELALKRVGPNQAETLGAMALHDHLTNFQSWIDRVAKNPDQLSAGIKDLERARKALEDDSTLEIKFDAEGKPTWDGDVINPKRQAALEKAEATRAETAKKQLDSAKERAKEALGDTPGTEQWLLNVENYIGPEGRGAMPFFEMLASRAGEIDMARFRPLVEDVLNDGRITPAQRRGLVEHALAPGVDGVQFLDNVRWLAEHSQLPEARANLMNSAMKGTLDIQWLKSRTELTPVELDQLALRKNTPWNKIQIASEYAEMQRAKAQQYGPQPEPTAESLAADAAAKEAAGKANKGAQYPVRGVAGEIAATRAKLPHGFEIVEHGTPQADGLHPDYLLRDKAGQEADLEVKGTNPQSFEKALREMKNGTADKSTKDAMARMVKQLKGSRARGRKVYLAVSEGIGETGRERLKSFLKNENAMPDEIVYMSEADILETARSLREHLGIEQPGVGPGDEPTGTGPGDE